MHAEVFKVNYIDIFNLFWNVSKIKMVWWVNKGLDKHTVVW